MTLEESEASTLSSVCSGGSTFTGTATDQVLVVVAHHLEIKHKRLAYVLVTENSSAMHAEPALGDLGQHLGLLFDRGQLLLKLLLLISH